MTGQAPCGNSTCRMYYGHRDTSAVIRLVGEIRYTTCCSLDDLIDTCLANEQAEHVFIDLRDATCIDSTSLGLLAKIANALRARNAEQAVLLTADSDINEVLVSMGFDEIFVIVANDPLCPEADQLIPGSPAARPERLQEKMYDAHSRLSGLNDQNRRVFEGVVGVLKPKAP